MEGEREERQINKGQIFFAWKRNMEIREKAVNCNGEIGHVEGTRVVFLFLFLFFLFSTKWTTLTIQIPEPYACNLF